MIVGRGTSREYKDSGRCITDVVEPRPVRRCRSREGTWCSLKFVFQVLIVGKKVCTRTRTRTRDPRYVNDFESIIAKERNHFFFTCEDHFMSSGCSSRVLDTN